MDKQTEQAKQFGKILEDGFQLREATHVPSQKLKDSVSRYAAAPLSSRINKSYMAIATLSAAAAVILIWVLADNATPLTFYVDDSEKPAEAGHWIQTGTGESHLVRFVNGCSIHIAQQTEARIIEADSKRVTIDLNDGALNVSVVPKKQNRWTVRSGPYHVSVVGTRFYVAWHAENEELTVAVSRGLVKVQGPGVDLSGIFVAAGSILHANGDAQTVAVGPQDRRTSNISARLSESIDSSSIQLSSLSHSIETGDTLSDAPTDQAINEKSANQRPKASISWKTLAEKKAYKEALVLARQQNLLRLQVQLSANELWLLATTARYAGAVADASALFVSYRKRFSNSSKSRTAAYMLAVLAQDHQQDSLSAKRWFHTYLKEAPKGALHQEALGRLMKLTAQMGDKGEASQQATSYLTQYPDGPFSELAKSILKQSVVQ